MLLYSTVVFDKSLTPKGYNILTLSNHCRKKKNVSSILIYCISINEATLFLHVIK